MRWIRERSDAKVFFTSDLHLGHGNIIKYANRPFLAKADRRELSRIGGSWHQGNWKGRGASRWRITQEAVDMMDDELIRQINLTVGENDVLWMLGDFSMSSKSFSGKKYYDRCKRYRDRIKCQNIKKIWGNHDEEEDIQDLFSATYDLAHVTVQNQNLVLCHYAMAIFNKSHRGAIHLYGHSHSSAEPFLDRMMPGRRSMDVGVDNAVKILGAYRPFSFEEIMAQLGSRPGFGFDHHVDLTNKTPEESEM